MRERKAISIREFFHPKDPGEGDCGEYLERFLTGVLSQLNHEAARVLLGSLFYVKQFSFEGVEKASMYIVSPEVSHLQSEFEDVHKEKDHAFVNCGTFLICSLEPSVGES